MWLVPFVAAVLIASASCHRAPAPTYEYEPPVTVTSTGAPGAAPGATTTTLAPGGSTWKKGGGG